MIRAKAVVLVLSFLISSQGILIGQAAEEAIENATPAEPTPTYVYVGDYRVTAYAYYEGGGENYYTASGATPVPYYTVATTDEFDFGTILYIEDIGIVEVQDRGGFPPGIIDLHIGYDTMDSFEDRTRAVYVVNY